MKLIIALIALTLFVIGTAYAQMKLEITPSDSKYAKMSIDCSEQADCDEKLVKWIDKQKFFKGEYKDSQEGSIVSKTTSDELSGESKVEHFHASNFSVNLVDMSVEIAEKALDAAIDAKFECGKKAIKLIAKKNVSKGLAKAKIKKMVKDYQDAFMLLEAGAIETAVEEINGLAINGTDITAQDKTDIVAFLNNCQ